MFVALVSTYEGGLQPLSVATAASHLLAAGHEPLVFDASLSRPPMEDLQRADLVTFSVPLFESLSEATSLALEFRRCSSTPVVFFGTYAAINRDALLVSYGNGVVLGDWEKVLVDAADRISQGLPLDGIQGLATPTFQASKMYLRQGHLLPARYLLPPLTAYRYEEACRKLKRDVVVGNVELTRGCRFHCSYCSIFAAYDRKVVICPERIALEDIDQVVRGGAEHICFVDAEFLNAPAHSLHVVRLLHERYPHITYDFTSRADLLAEDPRRLQLLVDCGARFVTSAFEFPKARVLEAIDKGFGFETLQRALNSCREVGLSVNPTFILFNPWTDREDLDTFLGFLADAGLENEINPIQFQTRLWLYKGSPLLEQSEIQARIVREHEFHYEWRHADHEVEKVFEEYTRRFATNATQRCCLKC
jgi:radical SAM superfamily enzyme YgiQ (UPF0313 family)